jgi:hypothetical protein
MDTALGKALTGLQKAPIRGLRVMAFLWFFGSILVALILVMLAFAPSTNPDEGFRDLFTSVAILAQGYLGYCACRVLVATAIGVRATLERLAAP